MKKPAVYVWDMEAPDPHSRIIQWTPPETPDSVGIEAVAELVVRFRKFVRQLRKERKRQISYLSDISDRGLRSLLLYAYRASFLTDEGRPVRARLAVRLEPPSPTGDQETDRNTVALRFLLQFGGLIGKIMDDTKLYAYRLQPPLRVDGPKAIAKLAPIQSERDGAITIVEEGTALFAAGLARIDLNDADRELLDMPGLWKPSAGLLIEILGPGHLRVSEGRATFTLFADQLVSLTGLLDIRQVRDWLFEVSTHLVSAFKADPNYTDESDLFTYFDTDRQDGYRHPQSDVWIALSRILGAGVSVGHGGAFAFLPDLATPILDIKYRIEPIDLGEELTELWRAHSRLKAAGKSPTDDLLDAAESKRVRIYRWLERLHSIGELSAADGCVVFDRDMKLHGFGGVIDADLVGVEWRRCVDLTADRETTADELLGLYGTRHKSAYALCHKIPNSIVFVISQDGDLRVFASDETTVYFASGLQP